MLIPVQTFKAAFAMFEAEFISSMKTSLHKFIVGAALAASGRQIDALIAPFANANGMIETDEIRAIIDAGMQSSGGQVDLPINFGILSSVGATPVSTRITSADVDRFFTQTIPAVANASLQQQ